MGSAVYHGSDSALFFTCSLIEQIGRMQKLERSEVVRALGKKTIEAILEYADVLHCEPIAKVADDYIGLCSIPSGTFDNVARCKYTVPDVWTIGKVYSRLITDVQKSGLVDTLMDVYTSWLSDDIQNYNSDLYYQPRDYLAVCWDEGKIVP